MSKNMMRVSWCLWSGASMGSLLLTVQIQYEPLEPGWESSLHYTRPKPLREGQTESASPWCLSLCIWLRDNACLKMWVFCFFFEASFEDSAGETFPFTGKSDELFYQWTISWMTRGDRIWSLDNFALWHRGRCQLGGQAVGTSASNRALAPHPYIIRHISPVFLYLEEVRTLTVHGYQWVASVWYGWWYSFI